MTACDQLDYALVYLSGYKRRKTPNGTSISRSDHLAYHLEGFMVRVGMISDRALKLVNAVFRLGIPPKECRPAVVMDNEHVKPSQVRGRLADLDKFVNPYRRSRNLIVHQGRYSDEQLTNGELFYILEKSSGPNEAIINKYRHLYKARTDAYVQLKRSELAMVSVGIADRVGAIFAALLPVVQTEYSTVPFRDS